MMKQMKSQSILISGFALPLALVLVVIFFTIIGSILFSARMYNQQLLDATQKLKLKNKAQINLEVFIDTYKNQCKDLPLITAEGVDNFSGECIRPQNNLFKIMFTEPLPGSRGKITSCAWSQKGMQASVSVEYECDINLIKIKNFN